MRIAPLTVLIVIAAAAAPVAPAAEPPPATPEPSRSERVIGAPDMTREFQLDQLSPFGRSNASFQTKAARTDSFYFQQKFQPKGYETKDFRTRSHWQGDFKFSTKTAATKTYETKAAPTKAAPVREAREAGKSAPTRDFEPGKREAVFRGRSQDMIDQEGPVGATKVKGWAGDLKQLSVGEVREILNKNK